MNLLEHPLVKIFTTFLLCLLLITPYINGIEYLDDPFVKTAIFTIAGIILLKKCIEIWWYTKK